MCVSEDKEYEIIPVGGRERRRRDESEKERREEKREESGGREGDRESTVGR
jgi:hypothetical protein